jgi:hypothetical protein
VIDLNETSVLTDAIEDLFNSALVARWIPVILSFIAPTYSIPPDPYLRILRDDSARGLKTNLDFVAINDSYRKMTGRTDNTFDAPQLILTMAQVQQDLAFARELKSDLSVASMRSELLRTYGEDSRKSGPELEGPGQLQEFVFKDAKAIREAVNSGQLPFERVLDLAEKSRPLHRFLADLPPDADIVEEYFREATSEAWVDKLPVAIARWLLVAGGSATIGNAVAGLPGAIIGAGLSGLDTAMARRKRTLTPNHFLGTRVARAMRE